MPTHTHTAIPTETIDAVASDTSRTRLCRREFCLCGMKRDVPIGVGVSADERDGAEWYGATIAILRDATPNRATVVMLVSASDIQSGRVTIEPFEAAVAYTPADCPKVGERIWHGGVSRRGYVHDIARLARPF